ncbi:MAG: CidA/LrgA family protein [Bacteroidetes bacterium]|uniref:CidA/LrgA family protein n=1 Tax=Candidatus Cryptobacteroides faecipullorum TaxID=2840764 RepID=A0A9D9I8D5_9BACT|nr:CidA/LrgA family protein [Candidatus Cryptobacteroides faecipullorum]
MVISGVFIIILYYVLGNVVSSLTGHFIPGSVIGMLLLFLSLVFRLVKPSRIRPVAEFLTGNMTVFFIPASLGIMEQWGLIRSGFIGWAGVTFITTLLVLVTSGLMQDFLIKAGKKISGKRS